MQFSLETPQFEAYKALQPGMTVGIGWGRGGGKSQFIRLMWYLLVAQWDGHYRTGSPFPGVRIVLLMADLNAAKRVHASLFLSELANEWSMLRGKTDRTTWRTNFPGGSWIQWVSAAQALSIKGLRCDIICVDECDQIDTSVIDARCGPWLTEPHSLDIQLIAGTPEKGRYGLLYRTWARANGKLLDNDGHEFERHAFSHATSYEFPHFVSRKKLDKERKELTPQLFEREYLCNWDAAEGLVYPHFREDFHVRKPPPDIVWREHIVGVDWGFEDPAVINVYGLAGSGRDVTIHQLAEWYIVHKTDSQIAEISIQVDTLYPGARWYADPSRPQSIAAVKHEAGVRIVQADNSIEDGVATVADALLVRERDDGERWAQLYISPNCTNTIREFSEYRRKRDPKNRERVLDDIEDKNNHAMDATRYALFTHFGGPERRLVTGYGVG